MTSDDGEWEFLLPWFDRVWLYVYEPPRIDDGRMEGDVAEHFRLGVGLQREDGLLQHVDGEIAGLRQLREALVLTHLMGIVKFDLWFDWFFAEERGYVDAPFIRGVHTLELHYAFEIKEDEHVDEAFLEYETSMKFLMEETETSAAYERDLARVQALLRRHGVVWEELEPIPITFRYEAQRTHPAPSVPNELIRLVREM